MRPLRDNYASLLALGLLVGCTRLAAPDEDPAIAGGKEDSPLGEFRFIQSNSPYYWAASDYDLFSRIDNPLSSGVPLPDNDPIVQRLQTWSDRIYEQARADVKRQNNVSLTAPKPIIKVIPSRGTFNAWAPATLACTPNKSGSSLPSPNPDAGSHDSHVSYVDRYFYTQVSSEACLEPNWPFDLRDFLAFWNRTAPACKLTDSLAPSGSNCIILGDPADVIAITAESPYLHFSTDLLAAISENTVVFVMAHEMTHYLRAHGSAARIQSYDFWYDSEPDRKKRPVGAADGAALQSAYLELVSNPPALQPLMHGRYSARLRPFLLKGIVPQFLERKEPDFVCAKARNAIGDWAATMLNGEILPEEIQAQYLDFENKLAACAEKLSLGAEPSRRSIAISRTIFSALQFAPKTKGVSWHRDEMLSVALQSLNARAVQLDNQAAALLQRLRENRIGLYTVEQEADELGFDLATRVGITPEAIYSGWLELSSAMERLVPASELQEYISSRGGIDSARCRQLVAADFTDTDSAGKQSPIFLPLGSFDDTHHGDCYRVFNLWRQQKLHKYTRAAPSPPLAPDWSVLQAEAASLSQ